MPTLPDHLETIERMFDDGGMGANTHDRDLRLARTAYIAAVRRFDLALRQFDASDIPMDPGSGPTPRSWTSDHIAIMRELVEAVAEVFSRRRDWDESRRDWRPQH
jgi:hypothetical protein